MNRNDQRITAYALGELRGEEREAFEAELATSEELQRELKETLEMIKKIEEMPPSEEGLSEEQRTALREECLKNQRVIRHSFRTRRMIVVGTLGTMAACMAIAMMVLRTDRSGGKVSENMVESGSVRVARPVMVDEVKPTSPHLAGAQSVLAAPLPAAEEKEKAGNERGAGTSAEPPLRRMELAKDNTLSGQKVPEPQQPAPVAFGTLAQAASTPMSLVTSAPAVVAQPLDDPATKPNAFYARVDESKASGDKLVAGLSENVDAKRAASTVNATGSIHDSTSRTVPGAVGGNLADNKTPILGDIPVSGRLYRSGSNYADADAADGTSSLRMQDQSKRKDEYNAEAYAAITENTFLTSKENPLSTFSIDVDTASYSNVRRFLQADQRPPADAVRIEELVNYFPYSYPQPEGKVPFSVNVEVAQAPWDKQHQLARIALKGREVATENLPPSNLVFLVDVSGSMNEPAKLPLLKRSLQALVEQVRPNDRVAIVVYAAKTGVVLPSTSGKDRTRILEVIESLKTGGSTNGEAGIKLAYKLAEENFVKDGSNRVILCTDGDFNVGLTSDSELVKLIEKERESGVFLSVLGFGTGNLKDSKMMNLADKGNGNYAYIDSFSEGRKVLVEQMGGTLFTIAKDVKIQVEFNPAKVAGYRLIGYEKRLLAKEDFNDDKKDAGEIGSGHSVTALYEIVPAGMALPDQPSVDALKYQTPAATPVEEESKRTAKTSDELFTVKLRYKAPDGDKSELIEVPVASAADKAFDKGSEDFQFATAVAAFGMKLRDSKYDGDISWKEIQKIARRSLGEDAGSYRAEFLTLVEKASKLRDFKDDEDRD